MAQFDQNDALPGEFPHGRRQLHGRRGESHCQRTDRAGHHPGRSPEKNNEQCTKYTSPNTRQW